MVIWVKFIKQTIQKLEPASLMLLYLAFVFALLFPLVLVY